VSAVAVPRDVAQDGAAGTIAEIADSGLDPEQITRAFVRWLQARPWEPISFAADVRSFADSTGVILRMERMASPSGRPLVRLTAERGNRGINIRIIMDLEPGTYRPLVQRIRFESGTQSLELQMTIERVEFFRPGQFQAGAFMPDVPLRTRPSRAALPDTFSQRREESVGPTLARLDASTQAAHEIEVLYTLHRLGACRVESLEVASAQTGWPLVRGVVRDDARRRVITDALQQLPWAAHLGLLIQTSAEASSAAVGPSAQQPPDEPLTLFSAISGGRLPIEDALRDFLRGGAPATDSQIAGFAETAISNANSVFTDSWALRRLIDRPALPDLSALPASAIATLDIMLRDHLSALERGRRELDTSLGPLLREIVSPGAEIERDDADRTQAVLRDAILHGNLCAQRILAAVNFLFAGARDPNMPEETAAFAAGRLLRDLSQLQDTSHAAGVLLDHDSSAAHR
jgi:hypothetical protein